MSDDKLEAYFKLQKEIELDLARDNAERMKNVLSRILGITMGAGHNIKALTPLLVEAQEILEHCEIPDRRCP